MCKYNSYKKFAYFQLQDIQQLFLNQDSSFSEEQINYTVDPMRGNGFYEAVRRYWPGLKDGALQPDYSGVRAKIVPSGEPAGDFYFDGPAQHGLHGLFNLYGFESPGLTSSLAIADHLNGLIDAL